MPNETEEEFQDQIWREKRNIVVGYYVTVIGLIFICPIVTGYFMPDIIMTALIGGPFLVKL